MRNGLKILEKQEFKFYNFVNSISNTFKCALILSLYFLTNSCSISCSFYLSTLWWCVVFDRFSFISNYLLNIWLFSLSFSYCNWLLFWIESTPSSLLNKLFDCSSNCSFYVKILSVDSFSSLHLCSAIARSCFNESICCMNSLLMLSGCLFNSLIHNRSYSSF